MKSKAVSPTPFKLSTGADSTLGEYRKLASVFFGAKAVAFIDEKIKESSRGADEPVVAAESQMVYLLANLP